MRGDSVQSRMGSWPIKRPITTRSLLQQKENNLHPTISSLSTAAPCSATYSWFAGTPLTGIFEAVSFGQPWH